MKVKELVKECEEKLKVGWDLRKFLRLAWYSFRGDFERIRGDISFNELDKSEKERFIEVCDNRIKRAGIFLNEVAMVLGFALTALSIIAVLVSGTLENKSGAVNQSGSIDPIRAILFECSQPFKILVIFLFACSILLLILLCHYRTHVHAWTAFKEEAILNEKGKSDGGEDKRREEEECSEIDG